MLVHLLDEHWGCRTVGDLKTILDIDVGEDKNAVLATAPRTLDAFLRALSHPKDTN